MMLPLVPFIWSYSFVKRARKTYSTFRIIHNSRQIVWHLYLVFYFLFFYSAHQLPDVFISFAWLYLSDFPYFIIALFAFYNISLSDTRHSPPPASLAPLSLRSSVLRIHCERFAFVCHCFLNVSQLVRPVAYGTTWTYVYVRVVCGFVFFIVQVRTCCQLNGNIVHQLDSCYALEEFETHADFEFRQQNHADPWNYVSYAYEILDIASYRLRKPEIYALN